MYEPTTKEQLMKEAKDLGMVAIFPESDEIQLDLDEGMDIHGGCMDILRENSLTVLGTVETVSKGGNRHVYIKVDFPLAVITQIAFAAALGSDPVREMLAALYFHEFQHFQMCLYEHPDEAAKVEMWRNKIKKDNTI